MTESNVELNVEGTGPRVRTQKISDATAVSASGAAQADTVTHQQVVTLADNRGRIDDLSGEILGELKAIRALLEQLALSL